MNSRMNLDTGAFQKSQSDTSFLYISIVEINRTSSTNMVDFFYKM